MATTVNININFSINNNGMTIADSKTVFLTPTSSVSTVITQTFGTSWQQISASYGNLAGLYLYNQDTSSNFAVATNTSSQFIVSTLGPTDPAYISWNNTPQIFWGSASAAGVVVAVVPVTA
jgi:hypothetical protein